MRRTRSGSTRGRTVTVVVVLLVFLASLVFLLMRTGVIAIGDSPRNWDVPDPDLAAAEDRVRAFVGQARQAVLDQPDSAEAWGRFGVACDAHLLYDAAAEAYRRANQLEPEDFEWAYHYAASRFYQSAPSAEVVTLLNEALALRPDYAPGYVRIGDIHIREGDTEAARQVYERAIEIDPDMAVARRSLGQVLLTLNEVEEAVRHLEQADRLQPNDKAVAAALAQGYMRSGQQDRATESADRARDLETQIGLIDPLRLEVDDQGVSVHLCDLRANRRIAEGRYAEAIDALLIVVEKFPDDPKVHFRLGACYEETGDFDRAVVHLTRSLELKEDMLDAHLRLGRIFWQRDAQRFIHHYRRAIELSPPNANLHSRLAIALAESGDLPAAIEEFRRAVEVDDGNPSRHCDLGRALMLSGDYDGALASATRAIELDAEHALANFIAGQILEQQGRTEEAIAHYRRSVRRDPSSPAAGRLMELTRRDD